jgi:hypothetical protein
MDKGSKHSLRIDRMKHGGFVVLDGCGAEFGPRDPLYASTTIEEALKFIKDAVKPVEKQEQARG